MKRTRLTSVFQEINDVTQTRCVWIKLRETGEGWKFRPNRLNTMSAMEEVECYEPHLLENVARPKKRSFTMKNVTLKYNERMAINKFSLYVL